MAKTGERIKEAMKIRNIRQKDLAALTGIDKGTISNYCREKYVPKQDKCFVLARALNVNPMWLNGADVPMELNADPDDISFISEMLSTSANRPDLTVRDMTVNVFLNEFGFNLDRKKDGTYFLTGVVLNVFTNCDLTEEQVQSMYDQAKEAIKAKATDHLLQNGNLFSLLHGGK